MITKLQRLSGNPNSWVAVPKPELPAAHKGIVDSIPDNTPKHKKLSSMGIMSPMVISKLRSEIERLGKSADPRVAAFVTAMRNRHSEFRRP
jgi:hypothetical protein